MTDIEYVYASEVELVDSMGGDDAVVEAARVSTKGAASRDSLASTGLIAALLREGHWSPFQHVTAKFLIQTPLFTRSQIVRHTSLAVNEESARYRTLTPTFYLPPRDRPLGQSGKAMDYRREPLSRGAHEREVNRLKRSAEFGWHQYEQALQDGVTREIARAHLPQHWVTSLYLTGSLRSWLHFLRVRDDGHAQWEIRQVASLIRNALHDIAPITLTQAMIEGVC